MSAEMPALAETTVTIGARLPELRLDLTPTLIISTALASRDFEEVHHDRDAAQERGLKDVFLNILSTNGFVIRYVTDWAGPDAVVRSSSVNLGVPSYAGDTLTLTGEVSAVTPGEDELVVEIRVRGANSLGDHVNAVVTISLAREVSR